MNFGRFAKAQPILYFVAPRDHQGCAKLPCALLCEHNENILFDAKHSTSHDLWSHSLRDLREHQRYCKTHSFFDISGHSEQIEMLARAAELVTEADPFLRLD